MRVLLFLLLCIVMYFHQMLLLNYFYLMSLFL